ncbi:MAG: hypothetical protein ACI8TP_003229 [Acidimicrobiales bacterium]|jgi:hypothetical protein
MPAEKRYVMRVWLPDRPGALGAVASRLGSLKGDVIGLEIIERHGGMAVDELVVALPESVPLELVAREVGSEEDVHVEDIRALGDAAYDPQLDALEAAAILLGADSFDDLAWALCEHVGRCVRSDWATVIDGNSDVASVGPAPVYSWLNAFVAGSPAAESLGEDHDLDTIWMPLPAAGASLVIGRDAPFRARERQRLAALSRIADAWFRRLRQQAAVRSASVHPSSHAEMTTAGATLGPWPKRSLLSAPF